MAERRENVVDVQPEHLGDVAGVLADLVLLAQDLRAHAADRGRTDATPGSSRTGESGPSGIKASAMSALASPPRSTRSRNVTARQFSSSWPEVSS